MITYLKDQDTYDRFSAYLGSSDSDTVLVGLALLNGIKNYRDNVYFIAKLIYENRERIEVGKVWFSKTCKEILFRLQAIPSHYVKERYQFYQPNHFYYYSTVFVNNANIMSQEHRQFFLKILQEMQRI